MTTKKDYFLVSIIGFFFGLLLLPVLKNIQLPFLELTFGKAVLIIIGFAVFAVFALWIASLLGRLGPTVFQFAKFVAVGGLNTLLDLGILNTLIFISGIAAGWWYSVFKGISFIVAVINSYFWNKYWTFKETQTNTDFTRTNTENSPHKSASSPHKSVSLKEFSQFFVVSLVGFAINVGAASLLVNFIGSPESISPERWANIGALSATIISLVWNFVGYKFFVFKK